MLLVWKSGFLPYLLKITFSKMPTFIEKLAFFVLHLNYKKKFHPIIKLRSNLEQIHLIAFFFLKKKKRNR